jgi:putative Holliday junction resolvase
VQVEPVAIHGGTVLAFDFGTLRIGVAVGDTAFGLAHPLATITGNDDNQRFTAIAALIAEWKPGLLIVGLPLHADGGEHDMTERSRRFARQLEGRYKLTVELVDERYSTQGARSALREGGLKGRKHKAVRDQVAAQLILQDYFDQRISTTRPA